MRLRLVCGRSRVRSSGLANFFRGDCSWNDFYGLSSPSCQLLAKQTMHLVNRLCLSLPRESVVRLTGRLDITIAVDCYKTTTTVSNHSMFSVISLDKYPRGVHGVLDPQMGTDVWKKKKKKIDERTLTSHGVPSFCQNNSFHSVVWETGPFRCLANSDCSVKWVIFPLQSGKRRR